MPEGYHGAEIAFGLAAVVAVLSNVPALRRTKVSLAWTVGLSGLAFMGLFAAIAHYQQQIDRFTASPFDLRETYIRGKTFRVSDLANGPDIVLHKKVFEDCDIYGPGIIALAHGVEMDGITFGTPSATPGTSQLQRLDDMLLTIDEDIPIYGAIVCERCAFRRLRFYGVQFIVNSKTKEWLLQQMREGKIND